MAVEVPIDMLVANWTWNFQEIELNFHSPLTWTMSSTEFLQELRTAFTDLLWSLPSNVSLDDTLLSESITYTSSNIAKEFENFNASLCQIFGRPEIGIRFPEWGQQLNDLVEDFEVMLDTVVFGPESTKHLLDKIFGWGHALIAASRRLQENVQRNISTAHAKAPQLLLAKRQSILSFATPKSVSIKSHPAQPPMNKMWLGTLPFTKISAEEAKAQSNRDVLEMQKNNALVKQNERDIKQKKLDKKCAGAVEHQQECQKRKRNCEIASGMRNSAGRKVRKIVNDTVREIYQLSHDHHLNVVHLA